MPEYMIDILVNAMNQTTIRTILENELRESQSKYLDAAQKIFRFEMNSLTVNEKMNEISALRTIPCLFMNLDYCLQSGDFALANSLYSEAPDHVGLGRISHPDFESYYVWFDLSQRLLQGAISFDSLPQPFINELEVIANDYHLSYIGLKAPSILSYFNDYEFIYDVLVPESKAIPKALTQKKIKKQEEIRPFPSPGDDLVNLVLNLSDPRYVNGELVIQNMEGAQILRQSILHLDQECVVNTGNWSNGFYILSIHKFGRPIISKSFEIIHT